MSLGTLQKHERETIFPSGRMCIILVVIRPKGISRHRRPAIWLSLRDNVSRYEREAVVDVDGPIEREGIGDRQCWIRVEIILGLLARRGCRCCRFPADAARCRGFYGRGQGGGPWSRRGRAE